MRTRRSVLEFDFEITESIENEKITYLVEEPQMSATITSILEPVEEGTKLTYAMDWVGGFLGFLARLWINCSDRESPERIWRDPWRT